jgi:PhnB protein
MQINPYLSFNGQCEAAFTLYARVFGGQVGALFRYAGAPMADQAPPDWQDKVMHGSVTIGALELSGADIVPKHYEQPRGFSLSVQIQDPVKAEQIFDALSREGSVTMALEKTFWAERFGMVTDRFGVSWMINCESESPASAESREK